ncbi:MAG: alpha/beta hydrolase [Gammaproteobacteria bacterium]|jgi:pimeloyl-ACP methyl ester carboxylesterase|nr:alpha/beta hydrolase [Gammaproteobacteria bacterium]|tara:strand:- start:4164 stop:5021 length:858 start_codon:yes stop_codon:yes gene_type:complete
MSAYEDIWYESDDGLKLYARDYRNDNAELTLLCLPGLTRNSADFDDLALALQGQYRVISVDQRGRGNSEWDREIANYQPARYTQDMYTLIDKLSLDNIVLVGTSLGGLMSMMMVALRSDIFRGVVINDIGPVVSQAGLDRIKGYVGKSKPVDSWEDAVEQAAAVNGVAFPNYQEADWTKIVHRMYEEDADGHLVLRYDPAIAEPMDNDQDNAVPPDLWPLFDLMKDIPLLTFRGELTDILSLDCANEMKRRRPDMNLVEVASVGHAPMLDEPEVMPVLSTFLASL